MRNRIRGPRNERVAQIISENYQLLRVRCARAFRRGPYSLEDVIQETVIYVITDPQAAAIGDDNDVIDYFVFKFKMVAFQTMRDNRKMLRYADDKKVKKAESQD